MVYNRASALSDVFSVYSPKKFPGMMESTALSKLFADQGLRIRIRTEAGTKKRGRKATTICSRTSASKRTKRSHGYDNQLQRQALADICNPSNSCPSVATGTDLFMRSLAATNGLPHNQLFATSSPTTMPSYNHNPTATTATGTSSSLLMLPRDPFSSTTYDYSNNNNNNKENIPPNTSIFESLHSSPMFSNNNITSHSSSSCATESKLDLNDIAAVALLDSLSSNRNRSTAFTTVTTSPAQSVALPATIAAPSSFQNYRIGPPLTSSSSFSPNLYINSSSTSAAAVPNGRLHTTFRSSAPTSSSLGYDIQLPSISQPFYNSQIRNNSGANVSGSNNIGISAATLPPLRGVPSQYYPPPTIN